MLAGSARRAPALRGDTARVVQCQTRSPRARSSRRRPDSASRREHGRPHPFRLRQAWPEPHTGPVSVRRQAASYAAILAQQIGRLRDSTFSAHPARCRCGRTGSWNRGSLRSGANSRLTATTCISEWRSRYPARAGRAPGRSGRARRLPWPWERHCLCGPHALIKQRPRASARRPSASKDSRTLTRRWSVPLAEHPGDRSRSDRVVAWHRSRC